MDIRPTTVADLAYVLSVEADSDASPFIRVWSRAAHEQAIVDPNHEHLIIVDDSGPAGFVLLAGLADADASIELRRIVVGVKNQGIGRRALQLIIAHVFSDLKAHRLWLDVIVENERARRSYQAVGFVEEGVLREALRQADSYASLIVMSILRPEWEATVATVKD